MSNRCRSGRQILDTDGQQLNPPHEFRRNRCQQLADGQKLRHEERRRIDADDLPRAQRAPFASSDNRCRNQRPIPAGRAVTPGAETHDPTSSPSATRYRSGYPRSGKAPCARGAGPSGLSSMNWRAAPSSGRSGQDTYRPVLAIHMSARRHRQLFHRPLPARPVTVWRQVCETVQLLRYHLGPSAKTFRRQHLSNLRGVDHLRATSDMKLKH